MSKDRLKEMKTTIKDLEKKLTDKAKKPTLNDDEVDFKTSPLRISQAMAVHKPRAFPPVGSMSSDFEILSMK